MTSAGQLSAPESDWFARVSAANAERLATLAAFLDAQPPSVPCRHHSTLMRLLDRTRSEMGRAVYAACDVCARVLAENKERERLRAAGVPGNLLHASFENWTPRDTAEAAHLEAAREFATRVRCGFLMLLGGVGVGKTHLGVSAMRAFPDSLFRTQSNFLRELRASYRDNDAPDPIARAQEAGLFVLDDVGLSGGGRDELPALHSILDHRHGERKPTVITSNLTLDALKEFLGDRITDRLRESNFQILIFGGVSHRAEKRSDYFNNSTTEDTR